MGLAVVTVASGGLPIVDVTATTPKLGLPVTETTRGIAVTKVAAGKPGLAAAFVSATGGAVATGDPFWSDVVFLSGFEGANGSTAFVDESPLAHTVTAGGDVMLDTGQFKFDTSSVKCNLVVNLAGRVLVSTPADFNFGGGPFTIEGWVRFNDVTGQQYLACQWQGGSNLSWVFWKFTDGNLYLTISTNGTTTQNIGGGGGVWGPVNNTWYYVAVSYNGTKYRLRVNGVMVLGAVATNTLFASTLQLALFNSNAGLEGPCKGWGDEWRITKRDRYDTDSAIAVPTARFPRGP